MYSKYNYPLLTIRKAENTSQWNGELEWESHHLLRFSQWKTLAENVCSMLKIYKRTLSKKPAFHRLSSERCKTKLCWNSFEFRGNERLHTASPSKKLRSAVITIMYCDIAFGVPFITGTHFAEDSANVYCCLARISQVWGRRLYIVIWTH